MTKTKTQARRELAEVFLKDANYPGQSWRSRTRAALDAAYVYALVLLGEDESDGVEHPAPEVLGEVAAQLGWPAASVAWAMFQIEHWDDPEHMTQWYSPTGEPYTAEEIRDSSPFPELMALALRLRAADELAQAAIGNAQPLGAKLCK